MATQVHNIKARVTAEDKASSVLKKFGIGGVLSLAAVTKASKDAFKAFEQQELATARLVAGIQNVRSASDKSVDSLLDQAAALQKVTRFGDEQVVSAQGILSTFQLNQKQIEAITPRLLDMAEGIARVDGSLPDLESNAILVAKAIGSEDVAGLSGALRRVGVVMSDAQEQLLKTGDMEERLSAITEILDMNFKGLAEAAGDTTAGKVAILRNQFGELQEKVGELMAKALTPLLNFMTEHPGVLQAVTVALGGLIVAYTILKIRATMAIAAMARTTSIGIAAWALNAASAMGVFAGTINTVVGALASMRKQQEETEKKSFDIEARLRAEGKTAEANELARLREESRAALPFQYGGFTGIGSANEVAGIVHKGEYVLPQDMVDQKTGTPKMGSNITIAPQIGVFAGSDMEMRKLAKEIMQALKDVAASQGVSLPTMLGA